MKTIHDIPTPALLLDWTVMESNLQRMQTLCDRTGTALWPHCKTHKLVEVLRRQLAIGATGATFAKVGEAEALLPSGVENILIAHSLVQPGLASRLKALRSRVDRLILSVTSEAQWDCLERLVENAGIHVEALIAVDTGLGREGARSPAAAAILAQKVRNSSRVKFSGIYTHEGHGYASVHSDLNAFASSIHARLLEFRDAVGPDAGLWPGCSVTAPYLAGREAVTALRPGAYVFGDLSLAETHPVMAWDQIALTVLSTIVDQPAPNLALIDAGAKTFGLDRSLEGLHAKGWSNPALTIRRLSEEHGFVSWDSGNAPRIQDRVQWVPAHVCPVMNLANHVHVVDGENIVDIWRIDARGMTA